MRTRCILIALACVACLAGPSAALEGARYQVVLHPISGWAKICSKASSGEAACYTSRHFGRDPKKAPILDLSIADVEGGHVARFLLPLGLRTQSGLTFSVDGGDRQPGRFEACVPNGCFAQAAVASPVLAAMRKGGTMQVTTTDGKGRRIDFYLSLDGFAAAYGGPGVDARPTAPPRKGPPDKPGTPRAGGIKI